MADGHPLDDKDRQPWLQAINDAAFAMQRTQAVSLIVCSSLKKSYRDILRKGNSNLKFIYLKGDFDTIESRLKARKGHFFKPSMLVTQFSTLEEPDAEETDVVAVDIRQSIDEVVSATVGAIKDAIH
ncbi:Thermoresistant gluconokinase [Tatumella ptyseos]|nr:Thermoresistant gluconokinase [Tatumella ptyseos]